MERHEGIDQLEELFHRALNLEAEARARFIAELRSSDPHLGAEVESLIAAHTESSNVIDAPAYEAAASLIVNARTTDITGSSINHYQVLKLLGRGGMGEVYRARDTRLNREVAIKVLPEAFANDAERLARFEREARMLASLNHPNIAVIHDLVEFEGRQVLIMELVEGETLADRLEKDPLPLAEALSISLHIAEALRAAHRKGIIHRDLKPDNIRITTEGQVKVLDFGLAKQVKSVGTQTDSSAATQIASMTATGMIVGTPGYMSPEQSVGEAADARSDIFSFGAVLYEMVTGSRAFSGNTITALLQAVLISNPASPRRLRSGIPAGLDALVMKALQKDKEQRHQSMEEICSELSRLMARVAPQSSGFASSTIVRLRNVTWRLQAWCAANRRKTLVASSLVVLLTGGTIGWGIFQWRADRAAVPPAAPTRMKADASAYELFQQGLGYLERYDKEENIDAAIQAFKTALSRDQNHAPSYAGLGMAYTAKFLFNRDKSLLDLAVQNAKYGVEIDGQLAINRISLGRAYVARGEYDLAESELKHSLILDPLNADAHLGLADLQKARGKAEEAERLYKKAIELRPADWSLHYVIGVFYYRLSRFTQAEMAFNDAIKLAQDSHLAHCDLGAVYHMQGRFPEAASQFQMALQIRPSAFIYSNLGTSLFYQGLYPESVKAFEEAIALGANHYQIWANLGDAYRQTTGNDKKAEEAFQVAIQLVSNELSAKPEDGEMRSQLALYLAKSGEKQEAMEEAARTEKLNNNAEILATLVLVYEICGQREQALDALSAALEKGHSLEDIKRDPELLEMRKDPKYHRIVTSLSKGIQN